MAVIHHACITVRCDICGEPLHDEDVGTIHFTDLTDAMKWAKSAIDGIDWTITADGTAVCGARNDEHLAAIAALLPPDPTEVIDGQIAVDEERG
jgi:hypothetical protein